MAAEAISKYVSKIWPSTSNSSDIRFLGDFVITKNTLNGLELAGLYIPEEIMLNIFANLDPQDIIRCSLVCKNWFNIARSNALWQGMYNKKEYPKKATNLPWYVFYLYFTTNNFKNFVKNGNGEEQFKYWKVVLNGGDQFVVEQVPQGSDPLPEDQPEFNGHSSCFATSYHDCLKYQKFDLKSKRLLRYVLKKYRPTLYASEWYAARFDCACFYRLTIACDTQDSKYELPEQKESGHFYGRGHNRRSLPDPVYGKCVEGRVEQFVGRAWEKLEILYNDYPEDIEAICFCHEGRDLQFWAGHYGSKMAGGVLKFLFDSIEPTPEDAHDNEEMPNN